MGIYEHMWWDAPEPDIESEPDPTQPELLTVTTGYGWWTAADVDQDGSPPDVSGPVGAARPALGLPHRNPSRLPTAVHVPGYARTPASHAPGARLESRRVPPTRRRERQSLTPSVVGLVPRPAPSMFGASPKTGSPLSAWRASSEVGISPLTSRGALS